MGVDFDGFLSCLKHDLTGSGLWSTAEIASVDDLFKPGSKTPVPIAVCRCSRKAYEANWTCGIVCDCVHEGCDQCQCVDDDYAGPGCRYRVCAHQNRPLCVRKTMRGEDEVEECQKNLNRNRTVDSYDTCHCFNGGKPKQSGECECPEGVSGPLCQQRTTYDPWNPPVHPPVFTWKPPVTVDDRGTRYREATESGLSSGAITALSFGGLAVLVIIVICITCYLKLSRGGKQQIRYGGKIRRENSGPLPVFEYGGPPPPPPPMMMGNWHGYPPPVSPMNQYPPDGPAMPPHSPFIGGPPQNYEPQAVEPSPLSYPSGKASRWGKKPSSAGAVSASINSTSSLREIPPK